MITMVIYAKIRRMRFRDNQTISEIARKTSLSRNTIKKWLRSPDGSEIKYRYLPSHWTGTLVQDSQCVITLSVDGHAYRL